MPRVTVNGIQMHYTERGHGEPLILIMGLSADGPVWELHAAEFEKHFRCILFDNRGVGQTDAPPGPYTSAQMADDTAALMDALRIPKAHVAGISMGGVIAQQLALRHPQKVQSQILVATWAKMDAYTTDVYKNLVMARKHLPFSEFLQLLHLWIFTPKHYNQNVTELKAGRESAPNYEYLQTQQGFEGQAVACYTHDVVDQLGKIQCPTLVTAGTQDIFVPYAFSRLLFEKIRGAEFLEFAGWGHTHHWEDLEKFNKACVAFMKKHPFKLS
jgi:pimeloyl-ACP methyl ester carboxylesterase